MTNFEVAFEKKKTRTLTVTTLRQDKIQKMFKYALQYDADLLLGKVSLFSLLTENGFHIKSTFTDINKTIKVSLCYYT